MDIVVRIIMYCTICMFVLFCKFPIKYPISEFKRNNLSFIHVRILIMQNLSLFSMCDFF